MCNPLCRSPRLDLLVKSMAELFGLNEHTHLKLFWRDEDGDLITIESDCDVAEAFRNISATSAVLRLEMVADPEVVESSAGPVADVEETVIHSHNQNIASRADGEADEIVDQHMEDQSGAAGETYDVDEPAGVCKSDPVVQFREHVQGAVVGAVEGAKVAMASAKEASQAAMAGLPAATRVVHSVSKGARGAIGEVVGVSKAVIATAPEAAKAVFANMTEVKNAVVAGMPQAQEQLLATVAKGSQAARDGAWMIRERLVRQMGHCSAGEEEEEDVAVPVEFQSMVRALMDMGFSEAAARDAVLNSKGNMDAALELALQHVPPTPPEAALVKVAPEPAPEPEPEPEVASWNAAWDPLLPELEEMGFLDTNSNRQLVVEHKGDLKNTVAALVRHERTKFQK